MASVWKDLRKDQLWLEDFKVREWELEQKFKDKPNPKVGQYLKKKKKYNEEEQEEETEEELKELSKQELEKELKPILKEMINILKKYMDLEENQYLLISIWSLGTYFHKNFRSYPYLFFNAMKGSGKSRLLNLVTLLSKDGMVLNSLTEAVLFRTTGTLGIDEFEGIGKKGSESLRELLNSAYKKTGKVLRMRKTIGKDGETQEVEEFEVYRPIIMANIWGMDETLGDRCIQLILEKSVNKRIVKLIEDFEDNSLIQGVKKKISKGIGSFGSYKYLREEQQNWNNYIIKTTTPVTPVTPNIPITPNTPITPNNNNNNNNIYDKINNTDLLGRDLELFFPLFIISNLCGKLDEMLKIANKIVKERKEKDIFESTDVQVYDFVSQHTNTSFIRVSDLTQQFRNFCGIEEKADLWINTRWVGRALKRLQLILDKKKISGMLVILNIEKAKEKIKMFRDVDDIDVPIVKVGEKGVQKSLNSKNE